MIHLFSALTRKMTSNILFLRPMNVSIKTLTGIFHSFDLYEEFPSFNFEFVAALIFHFCEANGRCYSSAFIYVMNDYDLIYPLDLNTRSILMCKSAISTHVYAVQNVSVQPFLLQFHTNNLFIWIVCRDFFCARQENC